MDRLAPGCSGVRVCNLLNIFKFILSLFVEKKTLVFHKILVFL